MLTVPLIRGMCLFLLTEDQKRWQRMRGLGKHVVSVVVVGGGSRPFPPRFLILSLAPCTLSVSASLTLVLCLSLRL